MLTSGMQQTFKLHMHFRMLQTIKLVFSDIMVVGILFTLFIDQLTPLVLALLLGFFLVTNLLAWRWVHKNYLTITDSKLILHGIFGNKVYSLYGIRSFRKVSRGSFQMGPHYYGDYILFSGEEQIRISTNIDRRDQFEDILKLHVQEDTEKKEVLTPPGT